jgi:hypothetical protein
MQLHVRVHGVALARTPLSRGSGGTKAALRPGMRNLGFVILSGLAACGARDVRSTLTVIESDVGARFVKGESIDVLARSLAVTRERARELVHHALVDSQRRYTLDR